MKYRNNVTNILQTTDNILNFIYKIIIEFYRIFAILKALKTVNFHNNKFPYSKPILYRK